MLFTVEPTTAAATHLLVDECLLQRDLHGRRILAKRPRCRGRLHRRSVLQQCRVHRLLLQRGLLCGERLLQSAAGAAQRP
jgi:hypothetical protein